MKALLLAYCLLISLVSAKIWYDCGTSRDHFQIDRVRITPDPPLAGAALNVSIDGELDEDVSDGIMAISIGMGFIPIFSQEVPLCAMTMGCPVEKGYKSFSKSVFVPPIPSSKYLDGATSITMTATDQNSQKIFCLKINLQLEQEEEDK